MAKVTSKLQLTLPKAIAEEYKIRPGDDLDWLPAGEAIRVVKRSAAESVEPATLERRLRLFDEATARQRRRERVRREQERQAAKTGSADRKTGGVGRGAARGGERAWSREELYQRGLPR